MTNQVGPKIRTYLRGQSITISELAHETAIPVRSLRRILRGECKLSAEYYYLICRALDLPLTFFIAEDSIRK